MQAVDRGAPRILCRFLCLAMLAGTPAFADEAECGSLQNAYGPFDYTNAEHRADKIPIVDVNHFQPEIEALIGSPGGLGTIMGALDYTLRAVPNHHRALATLAQYTLRGGSRENFRSTECYFDRAMRFKPDDGMVYLTFGGYLSRKHEYAQAEKQYATALALLPDSSEGHYNLGLLYLETGRPEKAKEEALLAYQLGYPLRGLRNRLARAGAWSERDDAAVFRKAEAATTTRP